jgi:uncharacterized protein YndB with AHSA1/START domain
MTQTQPTTSTPPTTQADDPVQKSVTVRARPERAFEIFTREIDTWWPRSHHIGKSPMRRVMIEERANGRCYTEQEDGTESDWGRVLVWDPPRRFVMAWQITHEWGYEASLAKSSEVEISFTPTPSGGTQVDLVHRFFNRHGAGADAMRTAVGAPNGWTGLLQLFAGRADGA